jgi:hypothetical protein
VSWRTQNFRRAARSVSVTHESEGKIVPSAFSMGVKSSQHYAKNAGRYPIRPLLPYLTVPASWSQKISAHLHKSQHFPKRNTKLSVSASITEHAPPHHKRSHIDVLRTHAAVNLRQFAMSHVCSAPCAVDAQVPCGVLVAG